MIIALQKVEGEIKVKADAPLTPEESDWIKKFHFLLSENWGEYTLYDFSKIVNSWMLRNRLEAQIKFEIKSIIKEIKWLQLEWMISLRVS